MQSNFRSAMVGFAAGLVVAATGAQAAVQAKQHEHPTASAQMPAADAKGMAGMNGMEGMKDMMADPAMRQKMMTNMAQCRDMMSMMMEHMGHGAAMATQPPQEPKH